MPGLYFEEFSVGQTFAHPIRRTVTEADNVFFTAMTHNPAQLHLDEEYGKTTEFGTAHRQFAVHAGTDDRHFGAARRRSGTTVANLGMDEVRFPKPVFHGDTLHVESEVLELREVKSRPAERHRAVPAPRHQPARRDRRAMQAQRADAEEARMILRSFLFVPADSEKKLAKARNRRRPMR